MARNLLVVLILSAHVFSVENLNEETDSDLETSSQYSQSEREIIEIENNDNAERDASWLDTTKTGICRNR